MKKPVFIFALTLAVSAAAFAHEFWLQPLKFLYAIGERAVINFRVGEEFVGEAWEVKPQRLDRMELHSSKNMLNLKDSVTAGVDGKLQFPFKEEGTHLVVMQTNNSFSDLEGEKFNAYLVEDALDEALAHRRKTNTLDKNGTEFYQRNAKLLIQVGNRKDDTYKKVSGLPLEIIPEQNPYALKVGDKMRFKILFEGKPLFGAKARVWNRHNNHTTVQNIFTEQDGMIETHVSNKGSWMVSVVKMIPSKDPKADWQSYWGSLVFGIQ